ncbi:MAG: phage tail tape measure protein [Ruminococcus sp.]
MAKKITGITVKIGGDTIDLQKGLKDINKQSGELQSELNQINRQLKFDPSSTVLLAQKQDVLKSSIEASKEKLKQLEDVQEDVKRQYKNGEIDDGQYRAYQREVEKTKDKIKSYEEQLKHAGTTAKETLSKNKQAFVSGAKTAAKWGLAVSTAMAGAGTAALKYSFDFETAFAKVETLLSDSIDKGKYKQAILDLSNELAVDANEVAESVYQALSASVNEEDAIKFVKDAYSLSKGGFTELSTAVDVETTAINAYKMSAKDAAKVNDILITTQNKGKTTVDQLASKIGKVIPVAAAYNVSLEQLGTQYAILTAKGVNTANATTQIRSMLNELNTSGKKVALTLERETGKTFSQLSAEGKNVSEILNILFESVDGNKDAFANLFRNANAKSAALSLLDSGTKKFNKTLGLMTNSSGAAEKAYEKMSNTAEHKLAKIQTNIKNSAITVGNSLLPVVSDLLEEVEEELPNIQNMAKDLGEFIGDGAKWAIQNGDTILTILKAVGIETVGIYTAIKLNSATKYIIQTIDAMRTLKATTDAVKVATEGATVAQTALNTAEKANVIGAVVSGLVILGTTLYNVYELTKDNAEATYKLNQRTEKLMETMSEETSAWQELKESRKKAFSEVDSEFGYYRELRKELDKIVDKNGKIKEGYEDRAEVIVTTLNNALGTEIEINKGVVKSYKKVQEEIKKTIAVKKAEAQLSAAQESYDTAVKNKQSAFNNLSEAKKALAEEKKKLEESKTISIDAYNYEEIQVKKLEENVNEYENTYLSYVNTIDNYNRLLTASENGTVKDINKALTMLENNFISAKNGTEESLTAQVEATKKNYKDLKTALEEGAPGVTKAAVKNAKELKNQAVSELKTYKKSAENIADEAGKNAGKVNTKENKASGKENAKDLKDDVVKGLKFTDFDNQMIPDSVKKALSKIGGKGNQNFAKKQGEKLANNFKDGFTGILSKKETLNQVEKISKAFASGSVKAMEEALGIHSPSKETQRVGKHFADGFYLGILKNSDVAVDEAKALAHNALTALNAPQKVDTLNNIQTRFSPYSSGVDLNNSKVITNSPVVNVSFGNVSVRSEQDINAIADAVTTRVSENLANIVIREGVSMGH